MSIRYKIFLAFTVLIVLTGALALYGVGAVTSAGQRAVALYDGPLMGINHARSAQGTMTEARALMRSAMALREAAAPGTVERLEKAVASAKDDLGIVRQRIADLAVVDALAAADRELTEWLETGLALFKPRPGGVTELPSATTIVRKGEALATTLDDAVELVAAYGFNFRTAAEDSMKTSRTVMIAITAGTAGIGILLAAMFSYSLGQSLRTATSVADRVSQGIYTDAIDVRRRDELGRLLASLSVMQRRLAERSAENSALIVTKEEDHEQQVVRRRAIESEIGVFRETVGVILATVDDMTSKLGQTALTVSRIASEAGGRSETAASVARSTSENVQSVAGAADALGTSIHAITEQLAQATDVVQRASTMAQDANGTIVDLAGAAQRIDDVVAFIRTIAGQTNLLALNATIEAARAGESGRGFAIVAQEVKGLAVQTAKATEEIAAQMSAIQDAAQKAVASVSAIARIMTEIDGFTTKIAEAADHQSAATAQIVESIRQAASGTRTVATDIGVTGSAIALTGDSAKSVLDTAEQVTSQTDRLRTSVNRFLTNVAA